MRPSDGHGVPTPPAAELATPPEMHPRPAMAATSSAGLLPATFAIEPSDGAVSGRSYAAVALLLVPFGVLAASRRARSWVLGRVAA
jgi:hypothetical protein